MLDPRTLPGMAANDRADQPDSIDCIDCGRRVSLHPPDLARVTGGRCMPCVALPGWFLLPELRRAIEAEIGWRPLRHPPPAVAPDDAGRWPCEVPGCGSNEGVFRINGYGEPFRGRCTDHLHPNVWQELRRRRNTRE
jgi:hypothetical protein